MASSLYIGLLSGTSIDGIDAALVSLGKTPQEMQIIATHNEPIPETIKSESLAISTGTPLHFLSVATLDVAWGRLFAQSVLHLLEKATVSASAVRAIGSHGQTLWHQPRGEYPLTLQVGDPNIIAKQTQITTVADFRRADLAVGGQGAPLVPRFHEWFFAATKPRTIVNIGGIANITVLPGCLGFDTGPGNGLMDEWIRHIQGKPFDNHGDFARSGKVHLALLQQCLNDPYFHQPAPKSTGKDYFNLAWLYRHMEKIGISAQTVLPEDIQATLVQLTAISIAQGIHAYQYSGEVFVCGGGGHNQILMQLLQQELGTTFTLATTATEGLPPDWVEAVCFAWLAKMRVEQKTIDYTAITGASRATLLGALYG